MPEHPGRAPAARASLRPRGARLPAALLLLIPVLAAPPARAQDELLLNDDRVLRNQWGPQAALAPTGAVAAIWQDGRNGPESAVDYDIYLTTVRDPRAPGSRLNRRVNDDNPGPGQNAPAIAASPAGTFFAVWEDVRQGNSDIYGAALDSLGLPLGPNTRVNDDPGGAEQRAPEVSALGAARFIVVWGDGRSGQSDVLASYRTASGAPIDGNIPVSQDTVIGGSYQGEPSVAANASGLTLVVWLDGREGGSTFGTTFDIYGQWLDPSGLPLGGNFKINQTTGHQRNTSPSVAADDASGFVVAWIDRRSAPGDPGDVYVQRFGSDRTARGGNVRVNDDAPGFDQRLVRAIGSSGAALAVWEDVRDLLTLDVNVRAARVPYDDSAPGANFLVNSGTAGRQGSPGGTWDGIDSYLVLWEDGRNGPTDIYTVSIQADGTRNSVDTQLNDDAASHAQWRSQLGSGHGLYVATWTDRRREANDLYAQWVRASGLREGPNIALWLEGPETRAVESDAAVSAGGVALVAAHVTVPNDAGEIRGFLLPTAGAGPASSFWISDSLPSAQAAPSVTAAGSGFGAAWIDSRDGTPRVYGQLLDFAGSRVGGNHPVLAAEPVDPVHAIDLVEDPGGGFWLVYAEGAALDQRLWLNHLDASLLADRAPIAIAPALPGPRAEPAAGTAADGRVEVAWTGTDGSGLGRVFHVALDAAGALLGPAAIVGGAVVPGAQGAPAITVLGPRSIVSWQGVAGMSWDIWMQGYDGGVAPTSDGLRVDQDPGSGEQYRPGIGLDADGHVLVIWTDGRSISSDFDIVGRVYEVLPTSVRPLPIPPPSPPPSPPAALHAGPASPNPFSGVVGIPVQVPRGAGPVSVWIANVRGERVRVLHEGGAGAPRMVLRWDGSDARGRPAGSGVYWVVVESGGERRALRVVSLR